MDPMTTAVAGGLRARLEALDMLANNIANASTSGFKRDGEFYGIFQQVQQDAADPVQTDLIQPVIEKNWTDFSQGTIQETGNSLDFALSGKGWFAVNGPNGALYTRNGNFHVNAKGDVTTAEGNPVRLAGGKPLKITPSQQLTLNADGTLMQNGALLGRLEIVDFPEGALSRQGPSNFRPVDPNAKGTPVPQTEVLQGKLENANMSAPESAVRLVNLTRQFESLQKVLQIGADMNRHAIEEVAKV